MSTERRIILRKKVLGNVPVFVHSGDLGHSRSDPAPRLVLSAWGRSSLVLRQGKALLLLTKRAKR